MALNLPLNQTDINFLKDTKENTQAQNVSIADSSVTISTEISKLLLIDVPFKKKLDPVHVDIFEFEEELRRLNGTSIIQPLQERGFTISDTSGSPARLYVNDERIRIIENNVEIVNVPLFPVRGYSKSQSAGTNFDIWSRDRYGSTTSTKHTASSFIIDSSKKRLAVLFDTTLRVEIDLAELVSIEQIDETIFANTTGTETSATLLNIPVISGTDVIKMTSDTNTFYLVRNTDYSIDYLTGIITFLTDVLPDYEMTIDYQNQVELVPAALASTIQVLLQQSDPLLANATCIFNDVIKTFTIIAGHGDPTSSVEVVAASSADLKSILGFDNQYMIQGKFQNNLLNVEIDGQAAEIKISDFRLCFSDVNRGYNNDDIGFDWSGDLSTPLGYIGTDRVGPLFCSGINNGKDVARSIEAQLRIIGSGGFKDAMVHYFTDDNSFVIYSGTMGTGSSVHVLPASDSDRDSRSLLKFNPPQEERGNEEFFETLLKLFNRLASVPNISVSDLTAPSRLSHSILYAPSDGVNIHSDFQDFDATTTKIYDDGSRGLPRLYPNGKLTVDDSNDKINFFELINVEKTATIEHDTYENESFLAEAIQEALNNVSGGPIYTCVYKPQKKKFTISSDRAGGKIFSLLWQTGRNALTSIGNYIGYDVRYDMTGLSSYVSNQISFQMLDYFYPFFPNQFDGTPKVPDYTVDEQSALYKEEEYLNDENTMSFLDNMLALTSFDNEILINAWEQLASLELSKVNQEYTAIRYHRGAYANHISDSDAQIIQKTAAYNSVKPNRTNLIDNLVYHAKLLDIVLNTKTFIAGVDFTNEGSESFGISFSSGSYNTRVYNKPAPLVKYSSSSKHIAGRFNPASLWVNSITYAPEQITAFKITNPTLGTRGYSFSLPDSDGYTVKYPSDTTASILSSNSGTYDMSAGDTLQMKIDGGPVQTATFDATPGYTESRIPVTSQFIVELNTNDKIDFTEGITAGSTINGIDQNYTLEDGDQLGVSVDGGTIQLATFSATQGYQEGTVLGTSSFAIKTGFNDKLDFQEVQTVEQTITIPQGIYTGEDLATQIQTLLNSIGSSTYTITYDSILNKFTIGCIPRYKIVVGVNDKIDFKEGDSELTITLTPGTYTASFLALDIQNKLNSVGTSTYTVSYNVGTKKFTIISDGTLNVVAGVNDKLDFEEVVGVELTATIPAGNYTPSALATAIQTQLNTVGGDYTVSYSAGKFTITSNFSYTIQSGVNDKLDFEEIVGIQLTATIPAGTYTASGLATEIQTQLNSVGADYTVTYNAVTKKFTLSSDFSYNIQAGVNDKIDFNEQETIELTATIPPAIYTGSTLASTIQTQLNSAGYDYSVSYSPVTKKFTLFSNFSYDISGTNNKIDFKERGDVQLTSTLSSGTYTGANLATEIQNKLNSTGKSTYSISFSSNKFTLTSDGKIKIESGVNDGLDYREVENSDLYDMITAGSYTPTALATQIQNDLNFSGSTGPIYSVSYSANKFSLTSDGTVLVISGVNDKLDFGEGSAKVATLSAGRYSPSGLAAEIQSKLRAAGTKLYVVSYSGSKFTISAPSSFDLLWLSGANSATSIGYNIGYDMGVDNTGGTSYTASYKSCIFDLPWITGPSASTSIGPTIGFTADDTGSLSYTADNTSGIFSLLWNTGSSGNSVGSTLGFIVTSDDTGNLTYTSDNKTGIFNLLWNTGTNSATSIGSKLGFIVTSDDTGSLSYTSDNGLGIFNLLWNTGTNAATSIGTTIGFIVTSDDTGSLSYTSDNGLGIFNILWNSGSNSSTSIGGTIGYNIASDDTGSLAYLADYRRGILDLLWNTGTNSLTTVGRLIGFNVSSDDTGSLSYTSDYQSIILSILWATGSNTLTNVGYTLAFNTASDDSGAYSYLSDFNVEFYVSSGYSDQFNITRNGVTCASPITITSRRYVSTGDLLGEIQTQIDSDPNFLPGDTIVSFSTSFRFSSSTKGTGSTISTAGGFLSLINFSSPSTVNGTGNVIDISQVTAAEIVSVLSFYWTGVTVTVSGGTRVKVSTGLGTDNFQISDGIGNPNVELAFSTSLIVNIGKFVITIPPGAYTGTDLATTIQGLLNSTGGSTYSVDYSVTNVDKFTFVSNGLGGSGTFELLWNSGDNASKSIGTSIGFDVTSDDIGSLTYFSDYLCQFTVISGFNDTFTIQINSIMSAGPIVISQGNYSASSLIVEMTTQIENDPNFDSFDFNISYPANKFRITSSIKGTDSNVEVYEGTNDFLRVVCLDADAPVYGGGDVGNIDAVTVDEVAAVLNAEISGVSGSNDGNKVRITTLSYKGSVSSIEIVGGTCRTILGFNLVLVSGINQDNLLKVDIDSDALQDPIGVITSSSVISGSVMASSIQTLLRAIASGGYTLANCTFDETTVFQYFVNSLRIISGTYGSSSTVFVSDKTMKIVAGINDKIDFEETVGVELTATLTAGFYNYSTLEQEIKNQLELVGINTYIVTYSTSTKKLTISSNGGHFSLMFGSGTNASQSVADLIAFYSINYTGNLSYVSDGFVKLRSCYEELGYNVQTTEPGHDLNSIKVTINDVRMTGYIYWLDHGGGNRIDLDIDLSISPTNNISGVVDAINTFLGYEAKHDYAYLLGRVSGKFEIDNGDSLVVNANNTGNQTVTFSAPKAISESGSNPWTRIFSGSSDRLILKFDNLATENTVSGESLLTVAIGGEDSFSTNYKPIKSGSCSISLTRLLPVPHPVTLNEGADFSVNYGSGQIHLNSGLITGDSGVSIDYKYYTGTYEIILGTQLTPEAICAKIQQEVRALTHSNIEVQSTFSKFTCEYNNGKYKLSTGNGGTGSKLHVYDGSVNSAAPGLKLGLDYGGVETEGSGDVVNSSFVTVTEIVNKLNSSLTGVVASGPDYIKLVSSVDGNTTRVLISSCALASKLGFDIGVNNDSYPLVDLASVHSSTIKNVTDQEIQSIVVTELRGWETQKGNVDIVYYTIDNQRLLDRKVVIANRLPFIPVRKPQIPVRVAEIIAELVPSLYNSRKEKVRVRLNKKTGPYVRVGDKFGQQENNASVITTNNEFIATIDTMLP